MMEHIRRKRIVEIVECGDRCFAPSSGLLHLPEEGAGGPASSSAEAAVLCYALGLLELAERSRQGRAEAIIARAVGDCPASSGGGVGMVAAGMTLLLIWHRHRRILSANVSGGILGRLGRDVPVAAEGGGIREGEMGGIPALSMAFAVGGALEDERMMASALDALARVRIAPCSASPDGEVRAFYLSCLYIARTYGGESPLAHDTTGRLIRELWAGAFGSGSTGPRAYPALVRALFENGADVEIAGKPASDGRLLGTVNAYVVAVDRAEIPEEWVKRLRTVRPRDAGRQVAPRRARATRTSSQGTSRGERAPSAASAAVTPAA